ncbi:MAG: hypothetical protein PHR30_18735 [Gallionellaceae bacterium]|nr:hypothetical protein [Gallionellaceae bacterium]
MSKFFLDNRPGACYTLCMATYRTVKTVSIDAGDSAQDRRIIDAANRLAAKRDEPVASFLKRVLEIAFGLRKQERLW